jgi:hypothetical protein
LLGIGTLYDPSQARSPRAVVVYFDDTVAGPVYATQSLDGVVTLSGFAGAVQVGEAGWGGEVGTFLSGGSFPVSSLASGRTVYASKGASYAVTASADSGGTITPSGDVYSLPGGSVAFSFAARPGYVIVAVEIDGSNDPAAVVAGTYEFLNMGGDHTISVTTVPTFTVAASADSGSEITPEGSVAVMLGENMAFSFSAKPGYVIANVFVDGVNDPSAVSAGTYEFLSVDSDHTISVASVPASAPTFTVTASADSGSEITPSGSVVVASGGGMAFSFSAKPGYAIADVFVDGSSIPSAVAAGAYTFSNVDSNRSISVASSPLASDSPDGGADGPHAGPGDVSGGGESNSGVAAIVAVIVVGLALLWLFFILAKRRKEEKEEESP